MERLRNLIKEVLSTPPNQESCNCGCHSCENVGNPGVVLNEKVSKHIPLSSTLLYHVDNKLPIHESTLSHDSKKFIDLTNEARYLYAREIIHLSEEDIKFLYK